MPVSEEILPLQAVFYGIESEFQRLSEQADDNRDYYDVVILPAHT